VRTLPLNSDLARVVGSTFALFLALCLTGCDAVQGLVDGEADTEVKSDTPAPAAPAAAPVQPAANPGQPAAPADPVQILAAFRAIPPRDVTDEALQTVADVPAAAAEIKALDMTGATVGASAVTLLAKFPNLQSVKLSGVQAPPGSFAGFSPQSTFSEIDLDNSTLDDAGFNSLAQVRTLKRINLAGTQVSSAGLIPLGNLRELTDLDLSGTKIDNQITTILATLPLVRLNCSRTGISDMGLPQLAKISTLEDLTLSFNRGVTGVGFRVFKGAKLKKLDIGVTAFGVEGLMVLRGMKTLEDLSVYETGIIQQKNALIFGSLPNLKKLNIGKNAIDDAGLGLWFKGCRNLEHLNISATANVTSAGLAGLITLKNLRYLDCLQTGIEIQGARALKQKIPELTVRIGSGEEI
jgi:internalin A